MILKMIPSKKMTTLFTSFLNLKLLKQHLQQKDQEKKVIRTLTLLKKRFDAFSVAMGIYLTLT